MIRVLGGVTKKRILKKIQYEPLKECYKSFISNFTKVHGSYRAYLSVKQEI